MDDAGENLDGFAAHDWAGQAGTRWLAQLDRFESMIEPIGKALLAQAAYTASETVVDSGAAEAGRPGRSPRPSGIPDLRSASTYRPTLWRPRAIAQRARASPISASSKATPLV